MPDRPSMDRTPTCQADVLTTTLPRLSALSRLLHLDKASIFMPGVYIVNPWLSNIYPVVLQPLPSKSGNRL